MFRMILGCKIFVEATAIEHSGLFGAFKNLEKIGNIFRTIVPANESTGCKHRRTGKCSVDCHRAVSGLLVGHQISWIERNVRI